MPAPVELAPSAPAHLDERAPGERYYRHPGDVVRLVVWAVVTLALLLFIEVATGTSEGVKDDLGRAASAVPEPVRQLALAVVQVAALLAPMGVVFGLARRRRWRRLAIIAGAALAGALVFALIDEWAGLSGAVPGRLVEGRIVLSSRFPSLAYLAGASAAAAVAKPWLARGWRGATDKALVALVVTMLLAGSAGAPELGLAAALGALVGSAVLVAFGAPNRRPSPAAVAAGLAAAGLPVVDLRLERAVGGRAQLYRGERPDGSSCFVKVYGHDSRDADLLYRTYRKTLLRGPGTDWPGPSLEHDVEHETLLLLLAQRGGVRCPTLRTMAALPDGSMALATTDVPGPRLDALGADDIGDDLLDAVWAEVAGLHALGLAHRALRAANVLVTPDGPAIIDFGAGQAAAGAREQAMDRAELLVSTAALVGPERAVAAAARVLAPADLAAVTPFLQPLALSAATRRSTSKRGLEQLRGAVGEATGTAPVPLERLIRVRPRTLITVATLTGAFYVLLPQLANVDDSLEALKSANWAWLVGAIVMSGFTYVFSAVGLMGGLPTRLPFVPTVNAQLASSFVNRVTPANVGGMALNVRFMQKAGADPSAAVTAMGLNVVAGGIMHILLLVVFFAWAGQGGATGFKIPSGSKALVAVVVVLALLGLAGATRWGRKILARYVVRAIKRSAASMASVGRSPGKLAALFGGSAGVTLAYVAALACAMAAFHADVSFAQVGAVYLGSSIIAAAAPTPGGLGAMEAALVAGFTAIGLDAAIAVAAVLSYRLATFWLPIAPGWLSFHVLERRNFI